MKTKLDWKHIGQMVPVLSKLMSLIVATMKAQKVGLGILDWLVGKGQKECISALKKLAESYKRSASANSSKKSRSDAVRVIHTATVDLSVTPSSPFKGATIGYHAKTRTQVVVEYRNDDNLYVNGKKIRLYLDPRQKDGVRGGALYEAISKKSAQNASLMDFLLAHVEFIPNQWKTDALGNPHCIHFWATVFNDRVGNSYVQYICFHSNRWVSHFSETCAGFDSQKPAAIS